MAIKEEVPRLPNQITQKPAFKPSLPGKKVHELQRGAFSIVEFLLMMHIYETVRCHEIGYTTVQSHHKAVLPQLLWTKSQMHSLSSLRKEQRKKKLYIFFPKFDHCLTKS